MNLILKSLNCFILTSFLLNYVYAQDCARSRESTLSKLREKKKGWEYIDSNPVSFDVDNCPKSNFYFVFKEADTLQINKQIIDCKEHIKIVPSVTTEYHIVEIKKGYYGVRIDQFNSDISLVVRHALRRDEVQDHVDFELLCEGEKVILRSSISKKETIENIFK